ncbi:MAG TPA: response regulator [Micropepsaceae bacterium]|jgi:CheY-like chemotaxis protein|nr:response regulator [Micropepsaceae bacterium]
MPRPRRILIVEDEMLVAMMIEDALNDLGVEVAGTAGTIEEALDAASKGEFDCAILDVHLHGKDVYPVADALAARGLPFIFATGYGQNGLAPKYRDRPSLPKPFTGQDLERVLAAL